MAALETQAPQPPPAQQQQPVDEVTQLRGTVQQLQAQLAQIQQAAAAAMQNLIKNYANKSIYVTIDYIVLDDLRSKLWNR